MTDATVSPCTTVAQLIYRHAPQLNFARLVADLDGALTSCAVEGRRLTWDHDDIAILDLGASRVALALADGPGGAGACVTVTVGYGPDARGDDRLAKRQGRLARLIVDRIAARFAPGETAWSERAEVATPDLLDSLNEAIAGRPDPEADVIQLPRPRRFAGPVDLPRILDRMEATLAARSARQPDPYSSRPTAANDVPDLPRQEMSGLEAVREALLWVPDGREGASPAAARLAAQARGVTLTVVMLPVDAAKAVWAVARTTTVHNCAQIAVLCGIGLMAMQTIGGG